MKKYVFEIALLIGLSFSLVVCALAKEEQNDISEKLIRLHVVANSDSDEDQSLKLLVRDRILERVGELTENRKTKTDAIKSIEANLDEFEALANEVCKEAGAPYSASVKLGKSHFPTKLYGGFALPEGKYDALKIELGRADGENWWCVLFPPLCVSAAEATDTLYTSGLSTEEVLLVTSDEPEYKFKFRIVELVGKYFS